MISASATVIMAVISAVLLQSSAPRPIAPLIRGRGPSFTQTMNQPGSDQLLVQYKHGIVHKKKSPPYYKIIHTTFIVAIEKYEGINRFLLIPLLTSIRPGGGSGLQLLSQHNKGINNTLIRRDDH